MSEHKKVVIYTDGGSRGNPGPASLGVWIETLNVKYGEVIGEATNNDAEYSALVSALKKTKTLLGTARAKTTVLECRLDSELIVKQMNHIYKINHKTTQKHFIAVWNLMLDFKEVTFHHVPRAQNKVADQMCNDALDGKHAQEQPSLL